MSLYAATIPSYQQTLGAVGHLIGKAAAFCSERGLAPDDLLQARLADDMQPFAYQVKSTAVHSIGAIEGLRAGRFTPDTTRPPDGFDALQARIDETLTALAALDPAEIDGFAGGAMRFEAGARQFPFTGELFLLSFSLPNFYFHAATAYGILRARGVPLGKGDYLGRLRMTG